MSPLKAVPGNISVVTTGAGVRWVTGYWHPVGSGQKHCYTLQCTRKPPATRNDLAPNVNSAEAEKPCSRATLVS